MINISVSPDPCSLGNVTVGRRRYFPVDLAAVRLGSPNGSPYHFEIRAASLAAEFRFEAAPPFTLNAAGDTLISDPFDLPDLNVARTFRAWMSFRADAVPIAQPSGAIQVQIFSGTTSLGVHDVDLSATVVAAVPTNVVFALDRSQRMGDVLDGQPRHWRMRMAGSTCLALLNNADRAAAVTFNGTVLTTVSFGALSSPVTGFASRREALQNLFALSTPPHPHLIPSGACSLAEGIRQSQTLLDEVTDKNVFVFTAGLDISSVTLTTLPFVEERRYAVAITEALSNKSRGIMDILVATGGRYFVAVDDPTGNSKFLLEKYACQALLETTEQQTVLDPDGTIAAGESHSFEFDVTEADSSFDVLVLTEHPEALALEVSALRRSGERTQEGVAEMEASRRYPPWQHGCESSDDGRVEQRELRAQSLVAKRITNLPDNLKRRPRGFAVRLSGVHRGGHSKTKVPYSLLVTTRSDLVMDAQLHSDDLYVGAELLISATVLQARHAPTAPVRVDVALCYPDGGREKFSLPQTSPGRFEKRIKTFRPGPYRAHFVAQGTTFFHARYRRESMQTIVILPESARLSRVQPSR